MEAEVLRLRHTLHRWRGFALARALYWRHLRRHECEICCRCGRPVWVWWHAPDDLWMKVNGGYGGVLCIPCFDADPKTPGLTCFVALPHGTDPGDAPAIFARAGVTDRA